MLYVLDQIRPCLDCWDNFIIGRLKNLILKVHLVNDKLIKNNQQLIISVIDGNNVGLHSLCDV